MLKWNQGENGYVPKYGSDPEFIWEKERDYFFLLISKLDSFSPDIQVEPVIINEKVIKNFSIILKYKHDPTVSNYSHFVIYPVFIIEDHEYPNLDSLLMYFGLDKTDKKKIDKFYSKMSQLLRRSFKMISKRIEEINQIPPCCFED